MKLEAEPIRGASAPEPWAVVLCVCVLVLGCDDDQVSASDAGYALQDAGPVTVGEGDAGRPCDLTCDNDGACVHVDGQPACECANGFDGETCALGQVAGLAARPSNPSCLAPVANIMLPSLPTLLSETGCFDTDGNPAEGLVPYTLRAPLWSDGASKRRYMALPDGTRATLDDRGDFLFPVGTVLVKEFLLDDVRVETRLFMHHTDGIWVGYSYAWIDSDGSLLDDARLLPMQEDAVTRDVPGVEKQWTFPSRAQCMGCHTEAAGRSLGLEVGHLNYDIDYAAGVTANQLYTLWWLGLVEGDIARFGSRAYPAYDDETAPVADRLWSYLNVNCSGCHYRVGGRGSLGRSRMPDVRYDLMADPTGPHWLTTVLCDATSTSGDIGLGMDALLISPGNPGDWSDLGAGGSVLYLRMAARPNVAGSTGVMPPIGTMLQDDSGGLALTAEWINEVDCP